MKQLNALLSPAMMADAAELYYKDTAGFQAMFVTLLGDHSILPVDQKKFIEDFLLKLAE